MTPKENVLEVINWGEPEYVPMSSEAIQLVGMIPADILENPMEGGIDAFGIPWAPGKEGPMVKPGFILFDDITEWREYIKIPDLSTLDWKGMAEKEFSMFDRSQKLTTLFCVSGIFMRLVNSMGFENGLVSLAMEPEECKAFFDTLSDYVLDYLSRAIDAYHPDMVTLFEDVATANTLFMSLDTYRNVIKPYHKKIVDYVTSQGILFQMHTCGKCEDVLEDFVDMGVKLWHSAQPSNDISALQDKFKGRLIIEGGWDSQGPPSFIDSSVEEVRAEVRRCMSEYGKKPGFIFCPVLMNERGNSILVGDDRLPSIEEEWKKYRKITY